MYALSRLERIFLQVQTAFGTLPNTGGASTIGNANACRFIKAVLNNTVGTIDRQDKTGTLSKTAGARGRGFGSWSVEQSVAPNGVAGVKPDCDPILQSLAGQAPTIVSTGSVTITAATAAKPIVVTAAAHALNDRDCIFISGCNNPAANGAWIVNKTDANTFSLIGSDGTSQTPGTAGTVNKASVAYKLADSVVPFALYDFRQPSTIDQRVGVGCVVGRANFSLGQDGASTWTAEGENMWVLSSNQFAVADTFMRAGLTAFPVEPAAPVTNGGIIPGFIGKAIVKDAILATLRTASVEINAGNVVVKDTFGSYIPTDAERDGRAVTNRFSIYEDDTTAFQTLVQVAHDKTAIETIFVNGTVPGSIMVIHSRGVQLDAPSREEERRFIASFSGTASGSSLANRDEVTIWYI